MKKLFAGAVVFAAMLGGASAALAQKATDSGLIYGFSGGLTGGLSGGADGAGLGGLVWSEFLEGIAGCEFIHPGKKWCDCEFFGIHWVLLNLKLASGWWE